MMALTMVMVVALRRACTCVCVCCANVFFIVDAIDVVVLMRCCVVRVPLTTIWILGAEIVHTCTMRVAHAHVLRKQSANDDIDKNIMITTGHTI